MESIHSKLSRVRKPRVHITYDVETEGAAVKKELPFVVGVMGDFAGQNTEALKPLKDRRFVQIDRDNFDEVLKRMNLMSICSLNRCRTLNLPPLLSR